MDQTQAIWIKDPLSILADGAERGIVIRGGKIVELVPRGREPATANATVYDASAHVVLPGLDQHPSSFLPDPDPGAAGGARSRTVSVAAGALSGLGAADAGIAPSRRHRGDVGIAAVGLHHHDRPSLRLPGRARGRRRYRGRCRAAARHPRAADARLDGPVAEGWRPAARQRGAGRGHDFGRQRTRGGKTSPARRGRDGADRAGAMLAVFGDDLADARDRRRLPTSSTSACTRIWPRPRTRTSSASRCMAAGRSIISNNAAGSMRGPGWRTASSSIRTR